MFYFFNQATLLALPVLVDGAVASIGLISSSKAHFSHI